MDPLGLVVGGAGICLVVIRFVELLAAQLNTEALNRQLEKLLKANNKDRAVKLLRAAPRSPYARIASKLIAGSAALEGNRDREGNERRLRSGFGELFRLEMAVLERRRRLIWFALALGLGTVFLGLSSPTGLTLGLGAVASAAAGWGALFYRRLRRDVEAGGETLIELLVDDVGRQLPLDGDGPVVPTLRELLGEIDVDKKKEVGRIGERCSRCGESDAVERIFEELRPLRASICRGCGRVEWRADLEQL